MEHCKTASILSKEFQFDPQQQSIRVSVAHSTKALGFKAYNLIWANSGFMLQHVSTEN